MTATLDLSLQFGSFAGAARHKALLPRAKVARWVGFALARPGEIAVRIVGEDEGRTLNRQYRHKDYATNVLTFDYTREPVVAADLVLCGPVVEREAREQGKPLAAHYAHLLVHGTLHAQGYDHETGERAENFERVIRLLRAAALGVRDSDDAIETGMHFRERLQAGRELAGETRGARGGAEDDDEIARADAAPARTAVTAKRARCGHALASDRDSPGIAARAQNMVPRSASWCRAAGSTSHAPATAAA